MSVKFFSKLSQNFIDLLKDDKYCDITIEVGEGPNSKKFRAHINIMCYRSPYLQRTYEKNRGNDLAQINLPSIHPEIFHVILEYIYGGVLSLNERDTSDKLKILVAAEEIEIWEYLLNWGLAKNPTLIPDPETWTDNDFKTMKNTLQNCLPSIRFFSMSSKEFFSKVRPYKKLFNNQLFEELIQSYMDPDSKPNENISPPRRNIKIDGIIDSKIVNLNIFSTISRLIDKVDINVKFAHFRELYLPYKFQLLLRGSRDGFTPKKFHELCDNKPSTITFIKIKGTDEIIGGYNPTIWSSSGGYGKTKGSFIFSFKIKNKFIEDIHISNVENVNYALDYSPKCGPKFGSDIFLHASDELKNYDNIYYRKCFYENSIRDTEEKFLIGDYEIFQINKVTICPD
ncbi:uncharacterized protein OCT59_013965 [Rhizophagus irregularis]|uniref:uncharacterized protein n=1 Tax=Rhizophagus irregularis TaxID=588596 RepID=UPI003332415F|nr:hypothetical protein OCT59_013965 [Rhizophagus irregularis]